MKPFRTVAFAVLTLVLPLVAHANLGETLDQAQGHEGQYGRQYGAVAPIFETSDRGAVIMECWAGPPDLSSIGGSRGWTREAAFLFARVLLPESYRGAKAKFVSIDGPYRIYKFRDGTRIVITEMDGVVSQLEVSFASWKGGRC